MKIIPLSILFIVLSLSSCTQNALTLWSSSNPSPSTTPYTKLSFPPAKGFVNDFAHVITDPQELELESILDDLQEREKIDVVVALIEDTGGRNIFDYSLEMAREWKIGSENGGVLLVVAVKDRKWHIQISKKTEEYLSNEDVRKIGEVMVPDFKDQHYGEAIGKCIDALITELSRKQGFKLAM